LSSSNHRSSTGPTPLEARRLLEAPARLELDDLVGADLPLAAVLVDEQEARLPGDAGQVHDLAAGDRRLVDVELPVVDEKGVEGRALGVWWWWRLNRIGHLHVLSGVGEQPLYPCVPGWEHRPTG
jgi:hypothetical protein